MIRGISHVYLCSDSLYDKPAVLNYQAGTELSSCFSVITNMSLMIQNVKVIYQMHGYK